MKKDLNLHTFLSQIYLERLLHYSELDLHPSNWKRILLGGILLASKVWDDQAGASTVFMQIMYIETDFFFFFGMWITARYLETLQ